jgi:hypothetical protein
LCHPPTNQQGQQLVAQRRRRKMEMWGNYYMKYTYLCKAF